MVPRRKLSGLQGLQLANLLKRKSIWASVYLVADKDSDGLSWVKCSFCTDYLVDGMWTSPGSLPVSVEVGSEVEREKAS